MKSREIINNLLIAAAVIIIAASCNRTGKESEPSLTGRQWIITRVVTNESQVAETFPEELKEISLKFNSNGIFVIEGLCNYSFGSYRSEGGKLTISDLGPGTKMLCDPFLVMQWEYLLTGDLKDSEEYNIADNILTIKTARSMLVFRAAEEE
ncbi:MAG: META domain-containing protein [Bacteroidales bacterium]|jgi:heat shock protein HslJ|nr:META domain-containing protein [Bacteroidales bacterium]